MQPIHQLELIEHGPGSRSAQHEFADVSTAQDFSRWTHSMVAQGALFAMLAGLTTIPLMTLEPAATGTAVSNDFLTRLEAVALVQTLNGEILASRSATLILEKWCNDHRLAGIGEAKIVARSTGIEPKAATAEQRHKLGIGPEVEVKIGTF